MLLQTPCSVVQSALPRILNDIPQHHFDTFKSQLANRADLLYNLLKEIKGLEPIKTSAAFYMMIKIDLSLVKGIKDDIDFAQQLYHEQHVVVQPSTNFFLSGFFRIVIASFFLNFLIQIVCVSEEVAHNLAKRIQDFLSKRYI